MPALHIPILRTERLVLEPLAPSHSRGMFALWSQELVCRHAGPAHDVHGAPIPLPAASAADSDRILDFFVRRAARGEGFRWAVIDAEDGGFVGAVGFNHLLPRGELAWHLCPSHWGQGLAAEAARAALDWFAAEGPGGPVQAFIDPANTASVKLAGRLGFEKAAERERWVWRGGATQLFT